MSKINKNPELPPVPEASFPVAKFRKSTSP